MRSSCGSGPKTFVGGALFCTFLLVFSPGVLAGEEKLPAFPGAEGFGSTTKGGRGGRIIEVTNLNPKGKGSLHNALRAKGPRIVVFRVGGIIDMTGALSVTEPFVTVAGQTAPGDGICVRGTHMVVGTHDVVIRYIRVRPGDWPQGPDPENRDAIDIAGSPDSVYNIVIDHCSFSWAIDETTTTWYGPHDVTIQWCFITESLMDSLHPKGPHGMGVLFGSQENTVSMHHCLIAHHNGRQPLIAADKGRSILDLRNNVIYNHGPWSCGTGRGKVWMNYVGNYIKPGPDSMPRAMRHDRVPGNKFYIANNLWTSRAKPGIAQEFLVPEPVEMPAVITTGPQEACEQVLRFAGCTLPVRDVVDDRIAEEVRTGTGRIIDTQEEVGGWPEYRGAPPAPDSDHDGMPDEWERKYGFDPLQAFDGKRDADGDGYTNVEEFLNGTNPLAAETDNKPVLVKVRVQEGNTQLRGKAAHQRGAEAHARSTSPGPGLKSPGEIASKARRSRKEVADYLRMQFVTIAAGEFVKNKIKVTITKPFELGACEVTQAQWVAVMGTKPWYGKMYAHDDPQSAVTYVNWLDCQEFIKRLNGCGPRRYRLPTQAEWHYAAHADTESPYGFGKDTKEVEEYAWHSGNTCRKGNTFPQPVGRKKPNPWGLYDVAGNAYEWCGDWFGYQYWRRGGAKTDPAGPKSGEYRVICGGSFYRSPRQVLTYPSAMHNPKRRMYDVGFRLARDAAAAR